MASASDSKRAYTFVQRLGVGGFGEVYRATLHTGAVDTDVAVKLLRPEFADVDSQAAHRLHDEARFLAALRHPGIVRVIDLVQLDGRLALVTEFLDGEDLRWVLRRNETMPVRAAVEVIARVADALHAAVTTPSPHTGTPMELIHRDVKPANVHLGSHGDVKLLDFGIARSDAIQRQAETEAYAILGTGTYSPPEAILRETPSAAGDIWSLAITGFEALSGEKMFPEMSLQDIARLVVRGDPRGHVLYRLQAMDLPEPVHDLLADMLEIEPEDRPSPAEVMRRADDLVDTLEGQTLRRWSQDRAWPAVAPPPAPLDGKTMEEEEIGALPPEDVETAPVMPMKHKLGGTDSLRPPTITPPPARQRQSSSQDPPPAKDERDPEPVPVPVGGSDAGWVIALGAVGAAFIGLVLLGLGWAALGTRGSATPTTIEPPSVSSVIHEPATPTPDPEPDPEPEDDGTASEEADGTDDTGTKPEDEPEPTAAAAPEPAPAPAPAARPTPRPRPRPRPVATKATLKVTSNRRVLVYIAGKPKGYAPISVELPTGTHEVVTMLPGQPKSRTQRSVALDADGETLHFDF